MSRRFRRFLWWARAGMLGATLGAIAFPAETIVSPPERIDDAEARLAYARILSYRAETLGDARAAYERLLQESPASTVALTELAELQVRTGDLAAAELRLRAALAARPGDPGATTALARLFLWTARPAESHALYVAAAKDRALTSDERQFFAQALSRLGRHAEAEAQFNQLLDGRPTPSAGLLAAAGDARLAAKDLPGARDLYARALARDATLVDVQRSHALTLAWTGDEAAARPRLEGILRTPPHHPDVIHAYVRAVNRLDGVVAAIAAAKAHAEASPTDARWRAEWAELEAQRGHAVRSQQLFAEALALGATPELELRFARAAVTWGDFTAAERLLRAGLVRDPDDGRTSDDLAQLLVSMGRTEEAEQCYLRWLSREPASTPALVGLVKLRINEKNFPSALSYLDTLLVLRPELPEALRLKANVLLALHRPSEAAEIYQRLASVPEHRLDAAIGLGRAWSILRGESSAAPHFATALTVEPKDPTSLFLAAGRAGTRRDSFLHALTGGAEKDYRRENVATPARAIPETAPRLVEWAALFVAQGDFGRAVQCLKAARMADPDYYPAWAQLAEFLAIDGQFDAALAEFAALRAAMPGNRQVLLGEARALAWSRRYDESLSSYAQLAALNLSDCVPRREAARAANWGKMRDRSAALYATAWAERPVDHLLARALRTVLAGATGAELTNRWHAWAEKPVDAAQPFGWAERFAQERFALREALPSDRRAALDEAYLSLLPQLRLQRAWWLENAGKQFAWDRQFTRAESAFRQLLVVEPGNEEALFDLSQAQAAQGLSEQAHVTLSQLMALDANNSLATQATRRGDIRSRAIASVEVRFWREHGRGELASLRRTALTGELSESLGEQTNLHIAAQAGRESPLSREGEYAYRGVSADVTRVFNHWLRGSAGFSHREFYEQRIGHVDTGRAQLWARHDAFSVGVGYEKREVLANEFALFQGTRADDLWLGATAFVTRRLTADARFTSSHYSDNNRGVSLVLRPAYAWSDHPRTFTTLLTLGYRDTDAQSIYVRSAARLTKIVFPYWTPQNYTHAALTLDWRHDLAKDFFAGSQEHFYHLRVTFGVDSESNPATTFEADWHREWSDRWIAHGGLYLNLSREWNALGLQLKMARRF